MFGKLENSSKKELRIKSIKAEELHGMFETDSKQSIKIDRVILAGQCAITIDLDLITHSDRVSLLRNEFEKYKSMELILISDNLVLPDDILKLCVTFDVKVNPITLMRIEGTRHKLEFHLHSSWNKDSRRVHYLKSMFDKFAADERILVTNELETPDDLRELCTSSNVQIDSDLRSLQPY